MRTKREVQTAEHFNFSPKKKKSTSVLSRSLFFPLFVFPTDSQLRLAHMLISEILKVICTSAILPKANIAKWIVRYVRNSVNIQILVTTLVVNPVNPASQTPLWTLLVKRVAPSRASGSFKLVQTNNFGFLFFCFFSTGNENFECKQ